MPKPRVLLCVLVAALIGCRETAPPASLDAPDSTGRTTTAPPHPVTALPPQGAPPEGSAGESPRGDSPGTVESAQDSAPDEPLFPPNEDSYGIVVNLNGNKLLDFIGLISARTETPITFAAGLREQLERDDVRVTYHHQRTMTPEQALATVLRLHGLRARRDGDEVLISRR